MKFTSLKKKPVIEAESGKCIGYIRDMEYDEDKGECTYFYLYPFSFPLPFIWKDHLLSKENIIHYGKDVILVKQR